MVGNRRSISSLYVLKALCAFFVVASHAPLAAMPVVFIDLGVPCFFMISGYFLYSNEIGEVKRRASKGARKALLLLLLLTPIYFLVDPVDISQTTLPLALRWIFVSIPNKYGGPLWYLVSLFWGLLTLRLYIHAFKGRGIHWLIGLTALGLVIGRYRFVWDNSAESSYFVFNFINYALPCLSIGYLARKYEDVLASYRAIDHAIYLSLALCIEESLLGYFSGGLSSTGPYILTFPTAFAWFWVALQYKDFGQSSFVETIGRDHSARIYYWHMLVVLAFTGLEGCLPSGIFYSQFGVFYVFATTLILSFIIQYLSRSYYLWKGKLAPPM